MNRVCPKCRTQTLKAVPRYRVPREVEDPPMACGRCGGMWTTVEEVSHLAIAEPDFLADLEIEEGVDPAEIDARGGLCPEGHGLLIRAFVHGGGEAGAAASQPFFLDRCMTCSGIWFDRGEWEVLARNHLLDDIQDLWTSTWQRKQRQMLSREEHLGWARELFGGELLDQLLGLAETLRDHEHKAEALAFLRDESVRRAARLLEDDSPDSESAAGVDFEARAAVERVAARDVPAQPTDDEPPEAAAARAAMPAPEPAKEPARTEATREAEPEPLVVSESVAEPVPEEREPQVGPAPAAEPIAEEPEAEVGSDPVAEETEEAGPEASAPVEPQQKRKSASAKRRRKRKS